jgi:hypothetical protein
MPRPSAAALAVKQKPSSNWLTPHPATGIPRPWDTLPAYRDPLGHPPLSALQKNGTIPSPTSSLATDNLAIAFGQTPAARTLKKKRLMKSILLSSAVGIFVLATLVAFSAPTPPVRALSCVPFSAERSVEHADVVLVGTVRELVADHSSGVLVEVGRYLKGSGPAAITFSSGTMAWDGWLFEENVGRQWLFFLKTDGESYEEWACSGSQPLDGAY